MIAEEHVEDLRRICTENGAALLVEPAPTVEVEGTPPGAAALVRLPAGPAVSVDALAGPADFEQVLHELAHLQLGIGASDWECAKLEAVWALELHPAVSLAVAEMAAEVRP